MERKLILGIPTLYQYEMCTNCINSAMAGTVKPDTIYVIDNGCRGFYSRHTNVQVIRPRCNLGVARSWNLLHKLAWPNLLVLSNDDIDFGPHALEKLVSEADKHPYVCLYGAACWSISDWLWDRIGDFEEQFYPAYCEDSDFSRRYALLGFTENYELKDEGYVKHLNNKQDTWQRICKEEGSNPIVRIHDLYKQKWGGIVNEERFTVPWDGDLKKAHPLFYQKQNELDIGNLFTKYGSDKNRHPHNYGDTYQELLGPIRHKVKNVLELGIENGSSLKAWYEFFPNAKITGFDQADKKYLENDRIKTVQGKQEDLDLSWFEDEYDVIIDDCSHHASDQVNSMIKLWPKLKPGGMYFVEDIQGTSCLPQFSCFVESKVFDFRQQSRHPDDIMVLIQKPGLLDPKSTVKAYYEAACKRISDINQLLPHLNRLASQCKHITSFGLNLNSLSALLVSVPDHFVGYDPSHCLDLSWAKNITDVVFHLADTSKAKIDTTDMLFIDTVHTFSHLRQELYNNADKVNKFIVMHDTVAFGNRGEDGGAGLLAAVGDFLQHHPGWIVAEDHKNNNGLMVLKR